MKAAILATIFFVSVVIGIVYYTGKRIDKEVNSYKVNIGKKVLIGSDSLIITDYSSLFENYTLSNGSTVSKELVNNQLNQNK
jgi:bifunctional N-acetylglucosamine-1-phosphate-uridyltransferase/glucosamine-1-phosphate-acetyltransferase GlmU-like protein